MRIESGKLDPPAERGPEIEILVDGNPLPAYAGESVAAALIANGQFVFRHTAKHGQPRGVYCGIGFCHECRMVINGVPSVRACITLAEPGMQVQRQVEDDTWRVN
jgi:hypothetical protein